MTMNNNTKNSEGIIPEEVLELVSWYAIGKLSVDDHALFEKALISYPSLQQELELEQQILNVVSTDHSVLDKSVIANQDERLKSVLNMIDVAEAQDQSKNDSGLSRETSFVDKIKGVFDSLIAGSTVMPQYSRVASVGILVLSVAVMTAFVAPLFTDKSDFTPASAVAQADEDRPSLINAAQTVLLVGFKGTSNELGNNNVLKGKVLKIETVPEKENMYQISFKKNMNDSEVKKTIDALTAQKELIWFAGEAH